MKKLIYIKLASILAINFYADAQFLNEKGEWAIENLKAMSVREKLGQIFMPSVKVESSPEEIADIENLIKNENVGGIFLHGPSEIKKQIELVNKLQNIAKFPLIVGQDLEWGLTMRIKDGIRFPKAITLGAIQDNDLIYKLALEIARQCKLVGVNFNAAPVVDVNNNHQNPVIGFRAFSDDKDIVSQKAINFSRGLQDGEIIACAKHFPGHGNTSEDSHLKLPLVDSSFNELINKEFVSFEKAIQANINAVMIAHIKLPKVDEHNPSTLSNMIIQDILVGFLNFQGLIITDALDMKAVANSYQAEDLNIKAFLAGNDILLYPDKITQTIDILKKQIENEPKLLELLDKKVTKILLVKEWLKLNDNRSSQIINDLKIINSENANNLKKELYLKAITKLNFKQPIDFNKKNILICLGNKNEFAQELQKNIELDIMNHKDTNLINNLTESDNLIIALYTTIRGQFDQEFANLLLTLKNKKDYIFILFGPPFILNQLKLNVSTIVAYEDDIDAQIAAAKVLLNQEKAQGVLPIKLNYV